MDFSKLGQSGGTPSNVPQLWAANPNTISTPYTPSVAAFTEGQYLASFHALVPPSLQGTPLGYQMAMHNSVDLFAYPATGWGISALESFLGKRLLARTLCREAGTAEARTAASFNLAEGEASLVLMKDGQLIAKQPVGSMLTHADFAAQNGVVAVDGSLGPGYWIGTVGKVNGQVVAMNSMTFYGNQLPNANATFALRSSFH